MSYIDMHDKDVYLKATGWAVLPLTGKEDQWYQSRRPEVGMLSLEKAVERQLLEDEARLGFVLLLGSEKTKAFLATTLVKIVTENGTAREYLAASMAMELIELAKGFLQSEYWPKAVEAILEEPDLQEALAALKVWLREPEAKP